jgi:hypothetical protein
MFGNTQNRALGHPGGSSQLIADADGTIEGSFVIPATGNFRFPVGTKLFQLIDVTDPTNIDGSTSYGKQIFTSAGVLETRQRDVISTRILEVASTTRSSSSSSTVVTGRTQTRTEERIARQEAQMADNNFDDPLAQSFYVTPLNGMFITKVDLYFAVKDAGTAPVWIELRAMENGFPSTEIINGSVVFKTPGEVAVSTDASAVTTFEFEEPTFLAPAKQYCIVIRSTAPTYEVYISKVGEFVLGTTDSKVTKQPFLGSLFKSQNNQTWTASQWEDLKMNVYTAEFDTAGGTVELTNMPVPLELLSEDPLSVDSGDATITVYQPSHGFTVGDTVNIANATDFAGISAASINGARTITAVDATGYQFEADSNSTSAEIGGGSAITADQNILMDRMNANLASLIPNDTTLATSVKTITGQSIAGTETAYQIQPDYKVIEIGQNIDFDTPQMIANGANETSQIAGAKSFKLKAVMTTDDANISPVIDMQRATVIAVSNTIDKPAPSAASGFNVPINYVAETDPKGGSSVAKHISSPITLAEDAVGMKVFIAANKPSAASFDVYYRVASGDDNISDISWTLVEPETALISDNNPNIFREYAYLVGGNTGTLDAFNQMQIKIVMVSENSSKPPIFRDIRSIALAT